MATNFGNRYAAGITGFYTKTWRWGNFLKISLLLRYPPAGQRTRGMNDHSPTKIFGVSFPRGLAHGISPRL
jgi:hypothetical protein